MSTHNLAALRRAQKTYIEKRNAAERNGRGGASRIASKQLRGGYHISYNGRVWQGGTLILCADGSTPIDCTNPTCRQFHPATVTCNCSRDAGTYRGGTPGVPLDHADSCPQSDGYLARRREQADGHALLMPQAD